MYVIIDTFTQYAQKVTENRHSKTVTPNALIWGDWQAVGRGKRDFQLVSLLFFFFDVMFIFITMFNFFNWNSNNEKKYIKFTHVINKQCQKDASCWTH